MHFNRLIPFDEVRLIAIPDKKAFQFLASDARQNGQKEFESPPAPSRETPEENDLLLGGLREIFGPR